MTNLQGIAFFIAGFVFDMLMLGRVDSWHVIGQQIVYLAVLTVVLVSLLREEGAPPQELQTLPRAKHWYFKYRSAAVNFLLGTLLNVYTLFFFKSSSLLVSFAFMGALVVLLLANEAKRLKFLGLSLKFALLGLCFLCFFAYAIPVFVGSIGLPVFVLSMAAGCVPLGLVVLGFLTFYLFRLVPPVPLSIPFIGVYHVVEKTEQGYRLDHERPPWR